MCCEVKIKVSVDIVSGWNKWRRKAGRVRNRLIERKEKEAIEKHGWEKNKKLGKKLNKK